MSYSRYGLNLVATLTLENGREVELRLIAPSCKLVAELVENGLVTPGTLFEGINLLVEDKPKKGRPPKRPLDAAQIKVDLARPKKVQRVVRQPPPTTLSIWTEEEVIMESTDVQLRLPSAEELGIARVPNFLDSAQPPVPAEPPCEKHPEDQYLNLDTYEIEYNSLY